ncbi:MAG: glycosyltransferase family 4 protein [Bryobacteraceae bacterium]|nr:glycosyltransferase family 4 protein [Bryobacteraceae bacterium]
MRIGILLQMAGRRAGGPETYEVELVRALAKIDGENQYVIYCNHPAAIEAVGVAQANFQFHLLRPQNRWISQTVTLPALILRDRISLLHSTFTPPFICPARSVLTVHCLSSLSHPEFYPRGVAWRLNHLLRKGIRSSDALICVSEATRKHVAELFPVPSGRLSVAHNGVSPGFRSLLPAEASHVLRQRLGIDFPYLLFVGKLQARKNIVRLIDAYALYRKRSADPVKLLLAGNPTGSTAPIEEAIRRNDLGNEVIRIGYVPEDCLNALYSAARMFLFPSLHEGFGIPLLEAMTCGTPVLTSNTTSLPEIAADAAVLVDPLSIEDMADGMLRLDRSPELRFQLVQKGFQRVREFTWEKCARTTLGVYQTVQ